MATSVPGQEVNPPLSDLAAHDHIRRRAERGFHGLLLWVAESLDLIKAAPADDADGCRVVIHSLVVAQASSLRSIICKLEAALTINSSIRRGKSGAFVYRCRASMPKFFIKTYGCQMNERDSEQVARSLLDRGYVAAATEAEADVVLLNTCSVRDMADQKALGKMGMLGRMAKERPDAVFGFLGCMAQARGAELLQRMPHVDLVVGTQKFHRVADYVEELRERKRAALN